MNLLDTLIAEETVRLEILGRKERAHAKALNLFDAMLAKRDIFNVLDIKEGQYKIIMKHRDKGNFKARFLIGVGGLVFETLIETHYETERLYASSQIVIYCDCCNKRICETNARSRQGIATTLYNRANALCGKCKRSEVVVEAHD